MVKVLIVITGFMILISCRSNEKSIANDNYLVPKGRLKSVIDSFVQVVGNKNTYNEIYINKWSPFESDILIFSGNKSLTTRENKLQDQCPLMKTQAKGVIFDIYSGAERYFNSAENVGKADELVDESQKPWESYTIWAVKDSAGLFNISSPPMAYPFMVIVDKAPDSLMNKFKAPVVVPGENEE